MFKLVGRSLKRRVRGFTLIELVIVLALLGILLALAIPRYLAARKNAYKEEAHNILQELKTLEWSYYQEYNSFDTTGAAVGFAMPGGAHWNTPSIGGTATSIQITVSGAVSPVTGGDSIWVTLQSDGSSSGGSSF